MSDRCLVTGASGFLGRFVVQSLVDEGKRVSVLCRKPVQDMVQIKADLTASDFDLDHNRFDTVYHLAGLAHVVPRTPSESKKFFQVNLTGTENLLRALSRLERLPQSIVMASTVAVYGLEAGTLLDEATPRAAVDPYGASKKAAEDVLTKWGSDHKVRVGIARLPLVVGGDAPGNLGAMVNALKRGRYLGIGAGAARRSMVMARDVAKALPRVADVGGVFHLTDGHHPSFAELETALSRALKRKTPRRLPLWLARAGARLGDGMNKFGKLNVPLTTRSLTKLTSTLTFSDEHARRVIGWQSARVLDHAAELI